MTEEQLLKILEKIMTQTAIELSLTDYTQEEKVQQLYATVGGLLTSFQGQIDQLIPPFIIAEYFGGVDEATAALINAGVKVSPRSSLTSSGLIAMEFQQSIHLDALQTLIDNSLLPLNAAIRTAREMFITNIDEIIKEVDEDIARGIILGEKQSKIQKNVAKSFAKHGLSSFLTSDNKWLPLDFYSMTVARSQARLAAVQGSVNRYNESNQDLVLVTSNQDTCEVCARFDGMVISLKGQTEGFPVVGQNGIRLPNYHPNCRCTIRPWVIQFKSPEEIAQAKIRNSEYNPEVDNRTPARKAAYKEEQKKRRIANAEKKLYAEWTVALGDKNFKNIGAFRRGKRSNSKKYQELREMVRTGNREIK